MVASAENIDVGVGDTLAGLEVAVARIGIPMAGVVKGAVVRRR
jgi:hypothetical protein